MAAAPIRFSAGIALAALGVGCVAPVRPAVRLHTTPAIELPQRLQVRSAGKVVWVALDDYVIDSILSEISPVSETEDVAARLFELQAIVSRTYAASHLGRHRDEGFDVCDSTHCQLYQPARRRSSRFTPLATAAALRTRSMVLTYDARPIEALFHADCGGATADADAVWGGMPVPYLRNAIDELPEPTHRPWRVSAPASQVRAALNDDPRTVVGRSLQSIVVAARDASGRAAGLSVRGERSFTVRGEVLRAVLNRALGERALLSTLFTIDREGANYVFAGTGFGHGVGLCQRGAATRIRRGDSPTDVLATYYQGVSLTTALSHD